MRRVVLWIAALASCGRLDFTSQHDARDGATPIGSDSGVADTTLDSGSSALLAGCVLHMPMEETNWASGVVDTCSGFTGTAGGGADITLDVQRGRVGNFDGGSACIDVPDEPSLRGSGGELTLSAWVKPATLSPASFGVIAKRTDFMVNSEYAAFLWAADAGAGSVNQLYVDITEDRNPDTTTTWGDNTWHQFTVVYDSVGSDVSVYVDGAHTIDFAGEPSSITPPSSEPDLAIGCLPLSGPGQALVGELDEVVIWNRALPASDVAGWYAATLK